MGKRLMKSKSAGVLVFRYKDEFEFLLVHPGGPLWENKDKHAWSIPKGECNTSDEKFFATALREFFEETHLILDGSFIKLQPITQLGGKIVHAWAIEQDIDISDFRSNKFQMEWPNGSGTIESFSEVDMICWFNFSDAKRKINQKQFNLLEQVVTIYREYIDILNNSVQVAGER